MKYEDAAANEETSLEVISPKTKEKSGIVISGYTPDSSKWRKVERRVMKPKANKREVIIGKDNQRKMEIDPDYEEKRLQIIIGITTNVTGFDDWKFTEENVATMLKDPRYSWLYEQWAAHLGDREEYFD